MCLFLNYALDKYIYFYLYLSFEFVAIYFEIVTFLKSVNCFLF